MKDKCTFTFEISFSQDYRSEDQLYREGVWYDIPRLTQQSGFVTQDRAAQEAKSLAQSFRELSGVSLLWRVKREEVVESGNA